MMASVDHPELTYVQDFVIGATTQIFAHAWCVDRQNRLVEPMWDTKLASGDGRCSGIRLSRSDVASLVKTFRTYGWYEVFSRHVKADDQDRT